MAMIKYYDSETGTWKKANDGGGNPAEIVRAGLTDTSADEWTAAERAAAQDRIGLGGLEAAINVIRGVTA